MFDLKGKYDKPDIEKRPEDKSRTAIFFELLLRKFWDLCKVNLLYFVTSIPAFLIVALLMGIFSSGITEYLTPAITNAVTLFTDVELAVEIAKTDMMIRCMFTLWFVVLFGTGPSSAGVAYILRNYAREEHAFIASDWWKHTRSNFRQAFIVWLIDIFVVFGICIALVFYSAQGSVIWIISVVVGYAAVVYTLLRMYLYQVMITFKCSISQLFRNCFTLMMQETPKALLLLLITVAIHVIVPLVGIAVGFNEWFWFFFVVAEIVFLPSSTMFMTNYFIYPKIEKYIKINKQE